MSYETTNKHEYFAKVKTFSINGKVCNVNAVTRCNHCNDEMVVHVNAVCTR